MIFLSYSWKDQPVAHGIEARLREAGLEVWIDYRDLRPDRDILWQLDTAIFHCSMFVSIERPDNQQSAWMRKELLIARAYKKNIMHITSELLLLVGFNRQIGSSASIITKSARKPLHLGRRDTVLSGLSYSSYAGAPTVGSILAALTSDSSWCVP
jgi:hypothetical protein